MHDAADLVTTAGGGRRPGGEAALRGWLLGRAGWRVVAVTRWEWEAWAEEADRRDYLRRRLEL